MSHTHSITYGARGVVCSNSPLAATAGINILANGGNAMDAALAVAAVEAVTQPPMCGLGGDVFAIIHHAASGKVFGINGSGGAPSGATREFFTRQGYTQMPLNGPLSISLPGAVSAWDAIHKRFCTRPFKQLLTPAIAYAEDGFPLPPKLAHHFAENLKNLTQFPATAAVLTKQAQPYRAGDLIVQKDLARSLRRIADGGADEFYRGALAHELVQALRAAGSLFTREDFADHQTEIYEPPISTTYRGYTIYQTQPPSQGFMQLQMLNLLEGFELALLGHHSADAIHLMVEAKQLAFADRNRYAGDPRRVTWPLETLLSKTYAARQRAQINPSRATLTPPLPTPLSDPNTSYFCVADGHGNAVSFIHSLSKAFGSDFIAEGTGILFNNRAGRGFSLQAGHPNVIAPGKRTIHTLNCYMAHRDGKPVYVGGTPGGDFQTQGNTYILTGLIDFGLDLQGAVDAPRWHSVPGTDPATLDRPWTLQLEEGFAPEVVQALQAKGHRIGALSGGGVVQLIGIDHARGVLMGASDARGDGMALAC